nr:immunoglobulin heavy chain junction region [Macaca mulatta]
CAKDAYGSGLDNW